jgi:Arc/MetJ-type ribon-helix-helix transcriptional regulator
MTITVRIPQSQEADLRTLLEVKGLSLSEFVREAIAEKIERESMDGPSPADVGRRVFGRHGSGRSDLAENRKAIFAEMLDAKHHR